MPKKNTILSRISEREKMIIVMFMIIAVFVGFIIGALGVGLNKKTEVVCTNMKDLNQILSTLEKNCGNPSVMITHPLNNKNEWTFFMGNCDWSKKWNACEYRTLEECLK
jgi:hypothetical protein